jgi:hypothetical protein
MQSEIRNTRSDKRCVNDLPLIVCSNVSCKLAAKRLDQIWNLITAYKAYLRVMNEKRTRTGAKKKAHSNRHCDAHNRPHDNAPKHSPHNVLPTPHPAFCRLVKLDLATYTAVAYQPEVLVQKYPIRHFPLLVGRAF